MPISYHIYASDGRGGDVNYAAPIATTTALSFVVPGLAPSTDNRYAVRAFDATSGIEEANTEAVVRVVLDSGGVNISSRPNAVVGLSARPTAGGTCWVRWGYDPSGQGGPPSSFLVTLTPGPAGPAASVAYRPGAAGYGCGLSGLVAGVRLAIIVRAVDASGTIQGLAASVAMAYPATNLGGVDALVAVPTA